MFIIIIFSRFDLQYDMFEIIFISLPIKKKRIGDEKEHAILDYLVCDDEEVHKKLKEYKTCCIL